MFFLAKNVFMQIGFNLVQSLDLEKFLEMESSCMQGYLCLDKTNAIKEFPSSMDHLTLQELSMRVCQNLRSLPSSIGRLKFLEELYFSGRSDSESSPKSQKTENFKGLKLDLRSLRLNKNFKIFI